jgi:hypothetical protein
MFCYSIFISTEGNCQSQQRQRHLPPMLARGADQNSFSRHFRANKMACYQVITISFMVKHFKCSLCERGTEHANGGAVGGPAIGIEGA